MSTPFDHSDALQREFDGASDRAAAIVAGAFLDELLQELLREFFVEQPSAATRSCLKVPDHLRHSAPRSRLHFALAL